MKKVVTKARKKAILVYYPIKWLSIPVACNRSIKASEVFNFFTSVYLHNDVITIFRIWGIHSECTRKCKVTKEKDGNWQIN